MRVAQVAWDPETNSITPDSQLPGWTFNTRLVAKPDQLIKRRGKAGLLALNKTWDEAKPWIAQRAGKPQKVGLVPSITPSPLSISCHIGKSIYQHDLMIKPSIYCLMANCRLKGDTRQNYFTRDLLILFVG